MVLSVWPTRRVWQTLCNTVEKVSRLLLVGVDDAVVVVGHAYFDVVVVGEEDCEPVVAVVLVSLDRFVVVVVAPKFLPAEAGACHPPTEWHSLLLLLEGRWCWFRHGRRCHPRGDRRVVAAIPQRGWVLPHCAY
jgi:energy-converting hydrogenase Eha subunit C